MTPELGTYVIFPHLTGTHSALMGISQQAPCGTHRVNAMACLADKGNKQFCVRNDAPQLY
jgi:hypothetical protein